MKTSLASTIVLFLSVVASFGLTTLNVTNYGAVGDAIQFSVNTTSNSTLVTTTNSLPNSYIGDAIEIFQAGAQTHGPNTFGTIAYSNEDLVAYVANIYDGTNIYITLVASNTMINAFATIGHDNEASFNNAINSSLDTNIVINIPAGAYLFLATNRDPTLGYNSINLNKGGLTFNGDGTNDTRLIGQGAWQMKQGINYPGGGFETNLVRGVLFEEFNPSNFICPVIFENMTLDGGVQIGLLTSTDTTDENELHGYPANNVDGLGWDGTHDAFVTWNTNNVGAPTYFNLPDFNVTWTNVLFAHWRGEVTKSNDTVTNANYLFLNSTFVDDNADCVYVFPNTSVSNCLFTGVLEPMENYEMNNTNSCYFNNNTLTNIAGNLIALEGGRGATEPSFKFSGNVFCVSSLYGSAIQFGPADNVLITSNTFISQNYSECISTLGSGYGYNDGAGAGIGCDNSNIVISANTFINPNIVLEIGGGINSTSVDRSESITVESNSVSESSGNAYMFVSYGWSTNIVFDGNNCSSFSTLTSDRSAYFMTSSVAASPYPLVTTNNNYYDSFISYTAITNYVTYGFGSRFVSYYTVSGSAYVIGNSDSNNIPAGAEILFANNNSISMPVYLNSLSGVDSEEVDLSPGSAMTFYWSASDGRWSFTPTFVQGNSGESSGSYIEQAFSSAQTSGDLNVVEIEYSTEHPIDSVTDSNGNNYQLAAMQAISGFGVDAIYYATNIAAGANTVTVTFAGDLSWTGLRITEYSGVNSLDQAASAQGSGTFADSGPVTTTAADEVIIGSSCLAGDATGPGPGFTIAYFDIDPGEYEIVNSIGTYHATVPQDASAGWIMLVATFK